MIDYDDDNKDVVLMVEQLKLRWYGSKYVMKYPRCSLRRQSTYADAQVNSFAVNCWCTCV